MVEVVDLGLLGIGEERRCAGTSLSRFDYSAGLLLQLVSRIASNCLDDLLSLVHDQSM